MEQGAKTVHEAILKVETEVEVPVDAVRSWFLSLEDHPERYAFETHGGFEFQEGGFGEVGARFRTREQFLFLRLELPFELTEVRESGFVFRLVRPAALRIWGSFEIEKKTQSQTLLLLQVGSETRAGRLFLRCYPASVAVREQIHREVVHIKQSVEGSYHV